MQRKVDVTFILGLDCLYDDAPAPAGPPPAARHVPAPIFAPEAPETAVAGEPFSLNAWVSLAGPDHAQDEVLPETFTATVDPATRTIVVTGSLRRRPHPRPAGPRLTRALVVGIRVSAPAGMWRLAIPEGHYAPVDHPLHAHEAPPARASQWLHVQPAKS